MSATSFRVVEDRRSSLGEETSISYTVPSPTSFEEKYGPAIEVDDSLKPHLMEFAREVNGGILLDQLAECMTQNGKKCCIVPFDSEFLKSSPGTSNEIFLTMMCDRATENGNHCSSEEIFGNFERRITAVLQSFETVNTSTSTLEHPDAASNGDDILWHVCNNRKMEEFPEYVVDVQMSGQENFAIRVFRWDGNSYDLKVDETVSPFQKLSDESIVDGYEVQQILQQIEESAVSANGEESISSSSNNVVSRGVRLIIPDFGDIVMSSEGNVALDGINTEKSVYLSSPTGVTISNSSIQQMEVVADYVNVACVGNNGTETSNIHTLHLRRREFSDNPTGSLLISDSAHLRVDEIFLEGSGGVINCGRLSISHTAALNGSGIFNLGIVDTDGTSDMVIFDKISYLQNEKNGIVRSNGQLIISSATVHNAGNMEAQALNMIVTGSLENYGTIHSRGACSITCCDSTYNCGIITSGGDLYVQTVRLDNDYGKIISRGSSKFNIRNRLDNHGNTILSHDVVESVECYTAIPSDRTWRRDVPPGSGVGTGKITVENMGDAYGCDPDNPSVITSYGPMIISIACGNFDNSFGEIYALSGINANASGGDIINENGRIFCNGRAAFSGKNFRNGHVRGNRVLTDASATREVDPEVVIGLTGYGKGMDLTPMLKKIGPNGIYPFVKKESVQIRNENLVSENATACCVDFAALKQKGISNVSISNVSIAAKSFCVPEHTESEIIKTYKTMASYGRASVELGQIYASEDVEISAEEEKYLGTITAGQNISIGKGREDISVLNGHDRYTLLAGGDVKIALSDISDRKYINVQAKSLQINTEHPITEINNRIARAPSSSIPKTQDIDLMALGNALGIFGDSAEKLFASFSLLPNSGDSTLLKDTRHVKFMGESSPLDLILSIIPDYYTEAFATMLLSPTCGRVVVDSEHLIEQLEQNGHSIGGSSIEESVAHQKLPAIIYQSIGKIENIVVDGVGKTVAICAPHLIYSEGSVGNLPTKVDAFRIHSAGQIKLNEGKFNGIDYKSLAVESEALLTAESEYVYSDDGKKVGIDQLHVSVSGNLTLSGDRGVRTRTIHTTSGGSMQIISANGSVEDDAMVTDTICSTLEFPKEHRKTFFGNWMTPSRPPMHTQERKVCASTFDSHNDFSMAANGNVSLESSQISAGDSMSFSAQTMTSKSEIAHKEVEYHSGDDYGKMITDFPMGATLRAGGRMTLAAKNSSLSGAQVLANEIAIPEGSNASFVPAMGREYAHTSTLRKKKFLFIPLGKTRVEQSSSHTVPVPSSIVADRLIAPGKDKMELTLAIVNIPGMAVINKDLVSGTAYGESHSSSHIRSRGLFPPRARAFSMPELGQNYVHNFSLGDAIPAVESIIGVAAEIAREGLVLSNLASDPHPLAAVANIVASKFSSFGVFDRKMSLTRSEMAPVPSKVEIGLFLVDNDETYLTGHWKIGEGIINTKKLTAEAMEHTVAQAMETKEWRISLVPSAFIPGLGTGMGAMMPSISMGRSSSTMKAQGHDATSLSADKLIIRCDDAVFRGATLRAKIVDMIVNSDMTMETLTNMFQSSERSAGFNASLGALSSLASEVKELTWDKKLAAVPSARYEKIDELHSKIDAVAQCIGTEEFYLKIGGTLYSKRAEVGLRPDGFVSKNTVERIEVNRRIEEELREINFRSRQVFNTAAVSEFGNMVGKINQLRAEVAKQAAIKQLSQEETDTVDKEVEKFLDQPQVRDSIEKLAVAEQRLEAAVNALTELEGEDVTGAEELSLPEETDLIPPNFVAPSVNVSTAGASQIPPAEVADNAQSNLSPEQVQPRPSFWENTLLKHAEFKAREREYIAAAGTALVKGVANTVGKGVDSVTTKFWRNLFIASNDYRKAHQDACDKFENVGQFLSKVGIATDAGQIVAGAVVGSEGGAWGAIGGGGGVLIKVLVTRHIFNKAIAKGEESFVNFAAQYAVGEEQRAEYKKTARSMYSATVAGASAAGMAKGALRGPKPKAPGAPKAAKPLVAREMEIAGTGMRVKVPVEESLVHREVSATHGKAPGGTSGEKSKPQTSRIEKQLFPEELAPRVQQRSVGNAGTYKELTKNPPEGGFNDHREAHHIPSKAFMEKHGVSKDESLAVMLTEEQHEQTRTYGGKKIEQKDPRSELAKDLKDVRKILKEDGDYTPEMNKNLLEKAINYENKFENVFQKGEPK